MNVKTYELLSDVIVKNNNKAIIKKVAESFTKKSLSKANATRVFANKDELKKLDSYQLVVFAEALHGATKNRTIKLSNLFSEEELQDYYQKKDKGYVEFIPRDAENLTERQLRKLEFLNSTYGNRQTKQYSYYVYLAHIMGEEDIYDKDLYEFEKMEIIDLMQGVIGSMSTKNNTLLFVKQYLDYCVKQGLTDDNIVRYIDTRELIRVDSNLIANDYTTLQELESELSWLESQWDINITPLDVMITLLLRSGIMAKDIVKLKNQNFDFEKSTLTYKNEQGLKKIKLDNCVSKWVEIARDSDGKIPKTRHVLKTVDDYIIKITQDEYSEEQALFSIRRRLAKFQEVGFRAINENILINNKKIDMLDMIAKQKGELTTDDFKRVQEHFGNSPASYYKLKTDYQATRGNEQIVYKRNYNHEV